MRIKTPQNRTGKFLYNSFFAALYQIVIVIAGFITPRLMLQYYGSEINGLITSITQFISYFNLVEAGLSSASIYALYKPLAKNDYKEISAIVVATQRFYMISGYIFLSLVIGLAFIYPFFIHVSELNYYQELLLVLILGFAGVLEFFTLGKYRALLTADQKLYIISISSILYTILNTIVLTIMAILQINVVIMKAVALSAILLRCFILYEYSKHNYSYINYKEQPNNQALNKRWDALYLQILGAVHTGAPVVIATVFTTLKDVSVYSIYNMVLGGISSIFNVFTNGLSSSFGDIIVRDEIGILQRAYQEFEFIYYSLITLVYSVSFIMIMPFISLYTRGITDADYYNPLLGILFVFNALAYNMKTPQGMLVISAGHYRETRLQVTLQGGIVIVASVLLSFKLGLIGIILGSIISNVYRDIDLFFYVSARITKLPVKKTIKKIICMIIEIMIICLPFSYLNIKCGSYFQWIKTAIVVTSYASVIIIVMGIICNRQEMRGIWKRIVELRRKIHDSI